MKKPNLKKSLKLCFILFSTCVFLNSCAIKQFAPVKYEDVAGVWKSENGWEIKLRDDKHTKNSPEKQYRWRGMCMHQRADIKNSPGKYSWDGYNYNWFLTPRGGGDNFIEIFRAGGGGGTLMLQISGLFAPFKLKVFGDNGIVFTKASD